MEEKRAIKHLVNLVGSYKAQGRDSISVGHLEEQLKILEKISDLEAEQAIQEQEHLHQWDIEMVRSCIDAGANALKACLLVSGGSAAALLAFASTAWSSLKPQGIEILSQTLTLLGAAIVLTGLASALTYLAQYFFADRLPWHNRAGDYCQWSACGFVLLAYLLVSIAFVKAGEMLTFFKIVKPILLG